MYSNILNMDDKNLYPEDVGLVLLFQEPHDFNIIKFYYGPKIGNDEQASPTLPLYYYQNKNKKEQWIVNSYSLIIDARLIVLDMISFTESEMNALKTNLIFELPIHIHKDTNIEDYLFHKNGKYYLYYVNDDPNVITAIRKIDLK
jgi:hypothetical protein